MQTPDSAAYPGRKFLELDFGPDTFTKSEEEGGHVGDFWMIMETRPYMRVMQYLVDIHTENGRPDLAAYVIQPCMQQINNRTSVPTFGRSCPTFVMPSLRSVDTFRGSHARNNFVTLPAEKRSSR